jgi:hypothetical protein
MVGEKASRFLPLGRFEKDPRLAPVDITVTSKSKYLVVAVD